MVAKPSKSGIGAVAAIARQPPNVRNGSKEPSLPRGWARSFDRRSPSGITDQVGDDEGGAAPYSPGASALMLSA